MIKREKIALWVVGIIVVYAILTEARFFKPTNYLVCNNSKGTFYLKIIQRTYEAEEYADKNYKFLVKGFTVDTNKNYMSLVEHGGIVSLDKKSKTENLFFINRKSLKIYDPIKKVNLGQCNSNENKI